MRAFGRSRLGYLLAPLLMAAGSPNTVTMSHEKFRSKCAQVARDAWELGHVHGQLMAKVAEGAQDKPSEGLEKPDSEKKPPSDQKPESEKAKPKKYVLDHDRAMPMDPRDPRSLGEGPCGVEHRQRVGKNQRGQWAGCRVCGLRLQYIPYKHEPAQFTKTDNPENVREALAELRSQGVWQSMQHSDMNSKLKEVSARKATRVHQPDDGRPAGKGHGPAGVSRAQQGGHQLQQQQRQGPGDPERVHRGPSPLRRRGSVLGCGHAA